MDIQKQKLLPGFIQYGEETLEVKAGMVFEVNSNNSPFTIKKISNMGIVTLIDKHEKSSKLPWDQFENWYSSLTHPTIRSQA